MIAALPMGAGRPIADPFEPTAEIVALLELRRTQLARGGMMAGRWTRRVREPGAHPRPRLDQASRSNPAQRAGLSAGPLCVRAGASAGQPSQSRSFA